MMKERKKNEQERKEPSTQRQTNRNVIHVKNNISNKSVKMQVDKVKINSNKYQCACDKMTTFVLFYISAIGIFLFLLLFLSFFRNIYR